MRTQNSLRTHHPSFEFPRLTTSSQRRRYDACTVPCVQAKLEDEIKALRDTVDLQEYEHRMAESKYQKVYPSSQEPFAQFNFALELQVET